VPGQMVGENVGQATCVRHSERVGLRRRIAIGLTIPTAGVQPRSFFVV
jgi:hypothetical protein